MKVLSIHWGLSLGGVAKYATTLERVTGIAPVTIRSVCILQRGRDVDRDALKVLGAEVVSVRSVADLNWITFVRKLIREEHPDCVISHGFNGHLVSLVATAFVKNSPRCLASYHGSYHATTTTRKLLEPVYNGFTHWFLRRKASAVVSVAEYCADYLVDKGVDSGKITVIHNGIPDHQPSETARGDIRSEWGFDSEHVVIGVASRLDPVKGIEYLLDAFARVANDHSNARLVIIGDGTVRGALEERSSALGIRDRVVFAGMRNDVPRCLEALDIFALPSLAEYHSIGLLEAMRAGLAIVATSVGGNTESVRDGKEGMIIQPADAEGLATALGRLVEDRDLRKCLGQAARTRFEAEFTEESMLGKTASWIQKTCGGQACV